jgi:ribonuclease HI
MIDKFLLVTWRNWFSRNEATHDKPLPHVLGSKRFMCGYLNIISNVKYHSTEDIIKGKRDIDPDKSPPQQASPLSAKRWTKPPPGWVKLSCDGSVKTEDGTAGAGMVLRDEYGEVIFSACRQLLACDDPFEAEAYACEDGLRLALEWSEKPIIVESDCSTLISAVQATTQDRSQFMHLLYEIKLLVNVSRIVSFVKVDRSQVRVSHCLANFARAEARTDFWLGSGPDCVLQALDLDRHVTPSA